MTDAIDHVIVCVPDLDTAVNLFEDEHRVASVTGGRHDGHGTANRLVPLGESYLELVAVVDPEEADRSVFGRWVKENAKTGGADAVAIRTDDLDSVCDRLGLEAIPMSRMTRSHEELRWRIAGMEQLVTLGLPFFIQWEIDDRLHPGRIEISHPSGANALGAVTVHGKVAELGRWIGQVTGIEIAGGAPGVDFTLTRADPNVDPPPA